MKTPRNRFYRPVFRKLFLTMLVLYAPTALGLDADRDQPATVEADEVEYDFRTGERTYKGNVIVVQGSLRITGDKLVVVYKNDELQSATAWGNLASFKQRPEGKSHDVVGKGKKIHLDQIKNVVTLISSASLQQGPDVAKGETIVYDINKEKLSIKGTASTATKADEEGAATSEQKTKSGRAKVVITPGQSTTIE